MESDDGTIEIEDTGPCKDLTCSVCLQPHDEINVVCRKCGHAIHATCETEGKLTLCPTCRSDMGFVPPRAYNELIGIIQAESKKVRCRYCRITYMITSHTLTDHYATCQDYRSHRYKRLMQQHKVITQTITQNMELDPVDLVPSILNDSILTVRIPDLRASSNRDVKFDISMAPNSTQPNHYDITLQPVSIKEKCFPLNLSILISDSGEAAIPSFPRISKINSKLSFTVQLETPNVAARLWINLL